MKNDQLSKFNELLARLEQAATSTASIRDLDLRLETEDFNDNLRTAFLDWLSPKSEGVDFVAKILSTDSYRTRRQEQTLVYAVMIGLSSGHADQRDMNGRREYFFINYLSRCLQLEESNRGMNFLGGFIYFNSPPSLINEVEALFSNPRPAGVNPELLKSFIEKFKSFPPFQYLTNLALHAAVYNQRNRSVSESEARENPLGIKLPSGTYEAVQRVVDFVIRLIYAFIAYVAMDIASTDSTIVGKRDRILSSISQALEGSLAGLNQESTEYVPEVKMYFLNMQAQALNVVKQALKFKELHWTFKFDSDMAALRCFSLFDNIVHTTEDPVQCVRNFGGTLDTKAVMLTITSMTPVDWHGAVLRQETGLKYVCQPEERPDYSKLETLAKHRRDITDKTKELGLKLAQFASNQKAIDAMDFKAVDEEQYLRLLKHNSAALRKGIVDASQVKSKQKSEKSSIMNKLKAANAASDSKFNEIIDG